MISVKRMGSDNWFNYLDFLRWVLKGEIFLVWCKRWYMVAREIGCSGLNVTSFFV